MWVKVTLHGCDDSTRLGLDVSQDEWDFLVRLAELSVQCSDYSCRPTLTVDTSGEEE